MPYDKPMENQTYQNIFSTFKNHFAFYVLETEQLDKIIKDMKPYRATKGSFIFKQGDEASLFFYIEQGSVKLLVNDEFKKNIA